MHCHVRVVRPCRRPSTAPARQRPLLGPPLSVASPLSCICGYSATAALAQEACLPTWGQLGSPCSSFGTGIQRCLPRVAAHSSRGHRSLGAVSVGWPLGTLRCRNRQITEREVGERVAEVSRLGGGHKLLGWREHPGPGRFPRPGGQSGTLGISSLLTGPHRALVKPHRDETPALECVWQPYHLLSSRK